MPHREFISWCAFNRLSPIGDIRHDYYLASIAAEQRRSYVKEPKKVKLDQLMFFDRMTPEKYKYKNLSPTAKDFLTPLMDKYS